MNITQSRPELVLIHLHTRYEALKDRTRRMKYSADAFAAVLAPAGAAQKGTASVPHRFRNHLLKQNTMKEDKEPAAGGKEKAPAASGKDKDDKVSAAVGKGEKEAATAKDTGKEDKAPVAAVKDKEDKSPKEGKVPAAEDKGKDKGKGEKENKPAGKDKDEKVPVTETTSKDPVSLYSTELTDVTPVDESANFAYLMILFLFIPKPQFL